jgi:hypothetical protein
MVNPTSLLSEVYGARTDAGRSAPSIRVQPPGRALAGWSVPFIADSSMLAALRLLARRVVHPDDVDDQIAFYERALGARCDSRTGIPDARLELVTVANLLLIGNPPPPRQGCPYHSVHTAGRIGGRLRRRSRRNAGRAHRADLDRTVR